MTNSHRMVTKKEAQTIQNQVRKRNREQRTKPGEFKLRIKQGHSDDLSLDDLLQDLKRHVSQADILLGILNQRGALANGRGLISSYANLYTVLQDPPCNLVVKGEPTQLECKCPEWWFPASNRQMLRRTRANAAFHHHENCPIQIAYKEGNI